VAKATVCKTVIPGFDSRCRLQSFVARRIVAEGAAANPFANLVCFPKTGQPRESLVSYWEVLTCGPVEGATTLGLRSSTDAAGRQAQDGTESSWKHG
jgi:hypothetical protein